jgi:hypothetical protein
MCSPSIEIILPSCTHPVKWTKKKALHSLWDDDDKPKLVKVKQKPMVSKFPSLGLPYLPCTPPKKPRGPEFIDIVMPTGPSIKRPSQNS